MKIVPASLFVIGMATSAVAQSNLALTVTIPSTRMIVITCQPMTILQYRKYRGP